jgi:hypothetical protein
METSFSSKSDVSKKLIDLNCDGKKISPEFSKTQLEIIS